MQSHLLSGADILNVLHHDDCAISKHSSSNGVTLIFTRQCRNTIPVIGLVLPMVFYSLSAVLPFIMNGSFICARVSCLRAPSAMLAHLPLPLG
jgi:hypothetical protein